MDKSYVTMEHKVCPVCCKEEETDAILLDKRLRNRFERTTVTGWSLCKEHEKQFKDGFVFLIGAKAPSHKSTLKLEEADRTGAIVSIKREALTRVCDITIPKGGVMFCEQEVITKLEEMISEE